MKVPVREGYLKVLKNCLFLPHSHGGCKSPKGTNADVLQCACTYLVINVPLGTLGNN